MLTARVVKGENFSDPLLIPGRTVSSRARRPQGRFVVRQEEKSSHKFTHLKGKAGTQGVLDRSRTSELEGQVNGTVRNSLSHVSRYQTIPERSNAHCVI